jgi:hypothetical protein
MIRNTTFGGTLIVALGILFLLIATVQLGCWLDGYCP